MGEGGPGGGALRALVQVRRLLAHGQKLQDRRPAGRRRRHADDIDLVGAAHGLAHQGAIGGDVGGGQSARTRPFGHGGGDGLGQGPGLQARRALARQNPHRLGIGGVLQHVPGDVAGAVGLGEILGRPARLRLRRIAVDHSRQARADDKTLLRQRLRVAEQFRPGQSAMLLLRQGQHGHGPGSPRRTPAEHRIDEGQRPSIFIEEFRRGRGRRRLAPVIDGERGGLGVVKHHEGAPAQARRLRLDQTQDRLDGHGRVHRRPAARQNLHPRLDRQGIGRRHEGPARRRLGRRRATFLRRCVGDRRRRTSRQHKRTHGDARQNERNLAPTVRRGVGIGAHETAPAGFRERFMPSVTGPGVQARIFYRYFQKSRLPAPAPPAR
ncbi:hypothetical protein D3C71_1323510 [compost metagenome]